jgi:hypothetical protein
MVATVKIPLRSIKQFDIHSGALRPVMSWFTTPINYRYISYKPKIA